MKRNKVSISSNIPVVIDNSVKRTLNADLKKAQFDKYCVFARSILGKEYEPKDIKITRGTPDPRTPLSRLEHDFTTAQIGRGNSSQTIDAYIKNFNRIYEFLGYRYKENDECDSSLSLMYDRDIGREMPILVFDINNFMAYYQEYLYDVRGKERTEYDPETGEVKKLRKMSQQTIVSALRHARAIIYFAQENGWVRDYAIKIKDIKPEIKATFTELEYRRLAPKPRLTADNFVEYRTWVMIQFLASTGMRIGSLLALDVKDIDFDKDIILVNKTKQNSPDTIPLVRDVRKLLNEYILHTRINEDGDIQFNEPLFPTRDGFRLDYYSARDAFKSFFNGRRVEWGGFHKFRHSYASNWIREGGDALKLKHQLGHSSLAMTNRYANLFGNATKEEANKYSLSNKMKARSKGKRITIKL